MERRIRIGLGVAAGGGGLCAVAVLNSPFAAGIIAAALLAISAVWFIMNHFFPAAPPAAQPPRQRSGSSPNVLSNNRQATPPPPTQAPTIRRTRQLSSNERQWAALQKALKTPSRTNLPAHKTSSSTQPPQHFSTAEADLRHQLLKRQDELGVLLARSRKKSDEIEQWIRDNVSSGTPDIIQAHLEAKLIIDALQRRFDASHRFLTEEKFVVEKARELLERPVRVKEDSVNHVSTGASIRPLQPEEWESTISVLFKKVSRKKSFYRGAGIRPSSPK